MRGTKTGDPADDLAIEQRELKLVVWLEPPSYCPVSTTNAEIDVRDIRTQMCDEQSLCEMVMDAPEVEDGRTLVALNRVANNECPCAVFGEFDCIPNVLRVGESDFLVEVFVSSRDVIRKLLSSLEKRTERLDVLHITTNERGLIEQNLAEVDLSPLTAKQRRAFEAAVDGGYYETGEEVTLADLAEPFDISRQAFAQRLAAAEQKIMTQLVLT